MLEILTAGNYKIWMYGDTWLHDFMPSFVYRHKLVQMLLTEIKYVIILFDKYRLSLPLAD
jgi:hypothetical protein